MTGFICALFVVGLIYVWKHEFIIGLLVGAAIFVSIFVATISGSFIPLFMHKLKIDPAVASGPFITTLNDVISVIIYLGLQRFSSVIFRSEFGEEIVFSFVAPSVIRYRAIYAAFDEHLKMGAYTVLKRMCLSFFEMNRCCSFKGRPSLLKLHS